MTAQAHVGARPAAGGSPELQAAAAAAQAQHTAWGPTLTLRQLPALERWGFRRAAGKAARRIQSGFWDLELDSKTGTNCGASCLRADRFSVMTCRPSCINVY